jgi:hypothetical protein
MKAAVFAHRTPNLGDDMQAYACLAHLSRVDTLLDRDRLADSQVGDPTAFIANSWFLLGDDLRTPPPWLHPVWHGFRPDERIISDSDWQSRLNADRDPIGCRDQHVVRRLRALGVPSYFSGCISLFLGRYMRPDDVHREGVVLLDVPPEVERLLPAHIAQGATRLSTYAPAGVDSPLDRWALTAELAHRLAMASLVITRRLHAALPAVGFATPVVAVPDPKISFARERFDGFENLMPVVFADEVSRTLTRFDWDAVPVPRIPAELELAHDWLCAKLEKLGIAGGPSLPATPLDVLGADRVRIAQPWPSAPRARYRVCLGEFVQDAPVASWEGKSLELGLRCFPGLSRLALRLEGMSWPDKPWSDLGLLTDHVQAAQVDCR